MTPPNLREDVIIRTTFYEPNWFGLARLELEIIVRADEHVIISRPLSRGWIWRPRGSAYCVTEGRMIE